MILMTIIIHTDRKEFTSSISSEGKPRAVLAVDLSARSFPYLMIIVLGHTVFPDSSYVLQVFVSPLSQSSLSEMKVGNGCGSANSSCARLTVSGAINHSQSSVSLLMATC